ncbi:MAG: C40 family peptidase [Treponema sp.]|jgi:cell wall-associated NlpC family hydrolase|nr:C40 family peptidase [Treponema sp.]
MMYAWVKNYIGIPFVSNGRTMDGCDCYGLVRLVLRNEYGIELPELSNDYDNALNITATARLFAEKRPILAAEKLPQMQERAVVVITEHGHPCHIGIACGGGYILHTGIKTGSVCQRATHPGLRGRIEGYYRVR